MNYKNAFWLGFLFSGWRYGTAFLTPAQAFALDQKLDDGTPTGGFMIASTVAPNEISFDAYQFGTANSCTTSANQNVFTGTYKTSHSTPSCGFIIKTGF